MHTFFVNTSNKINTSFEHSPLFENLSLKKEVEIINSTLDKLHMCVETIENIITRDDEIDEFYNIIVYVEIEGRNEYALALEKVTALLIEENLFSALYTCGRKANKALILYGENFTRDAEYGRGNNYNKNIRQALWNMFPLPSETRTAEIINKTYDEGLTKNIRLEEYQHELYNRLIKEASQDNKLSHESEFVATTIKLMIDVTKDKKVTAEQLLEVLFAIMENQSKCVKKQVTREKVMYAYVRLNDSDFHAWNRSEYRILLFVYRCAATGNIVLIGPNGEKTIEWIDWTTFATLLKEKRLLFQEELKVISQLSNDFPMFDTSLLNNPSIVSIDPEKPKLITAINIHTALTVTQLKKTVEDTLCVIKTKAQDNKKSVEDYITMITDNFNERKATLLKNITYKCEGKNIKNKELTKRFISEEKYKSEAAIVANKRMSITTDNIDELFYEARVRTEYLFDCLKKGKLLYVFGVLFTLLIAIPYTIVQKGIFDTVYGWLFYISTVGAVAFIYTIAYQIFVFCYKMKINNELQLLCDKFARTQRDKQVCLDVYTKLIMHVIPLSYCIRAYESDFSAYLEHIRTVPVYITYHKKQLEYYLKYTECLISNLDLTAVGTLPEATNNYTSRIALDKDRTSNDSVYAIIDRDVCSIFLKAEQDVGAIHEHN